MLHRNSVSSCFRFESRWTSISAAHFQLQQNKLATKLNLRSSWTIHQGCFLRFLLCNCYKLKDTVKQPPNTKLNQLKMN